jgi:hypothetical protein
MLLTSNIINEIIIKRDGQRLICEISCSPDRNMRFRNRLDLTIERRISITTTRNTPRISDIPTVPIEIFELMHGR